MGTLHLEYTRVPVTEGYGKGRSLNALSRTSFAQFNSSMLGLGPIREGVSVTNALAAIFDLEGFTDFCNQVEHQLVIPQFLSTFLDWLFAAIKRHFTEQQTEDTVRIWGSLPFFGKFTGDGVLFLWNTELSGGSTGIGNIALHLANVCHDYVTELRPALSKRIATMPKRLRVGIARGQVFSVGAGNDFVGPCINLAARLQKLGSLSFAVSCRGIDPNNCFDLDWTKAFVVKRFPIRDIGDNEPVLLKRTEFEALSERDKKLFR